MTMYHDEFTEKENNREIDLIEIIGKIWKRRKTVALWCAAGAIIGLVVAFSIPKEFDTTVKLAPEENDGKGISGSLGALAAMAGVSTGGGGADAVYPKLYPEIVKSVPFCLSLFDVPVTDSETGKKYTVAKYLTEEIRSPWWSAITGLPGKLVGALRGKEETPADNKEKKRDSFRLTQEEAGLVEALRGRIATSVDTKTDVVTISVKMQDPLVSATLADTVVSRLQQYVTQYRTNKARQDLEYIEQLNEEARASYYAAQQRYARYLDSHQGMVLYSAQTMRDRLENETTLAYNLFNQTSQQLQMAKAKVQEKTPVYATITPATVPIRASSPRKMLILAGCIILAFIASSAWILFIEPMRKNNHTPAHGQETV